MHVRVILIFMETDRHEAVVNARCHTFLFHLSLIWLDRLLESQYNSSIAQTNKWTHFQKTNFRRRKATVKQGNHILHLWFFEHLLQISISKKFFALVNKAASFYLTHSHPRCHLEWNLGEQQRCQRLCPKPVGTSAVSTFGSLPSWIRIAKLSSLSVVDIWGCWHSLICLGQQ